MKKTQSSFIDIRFWLVCCLIISNIYLVSIKNLSANDGNDGLTSIGEILITPNDCVDFSRFIFDNAGEIEIYDISDKDLPFSRFLRITNFKSTDEWQIQIQQGIKSSLSRSEIFVLHFWIRTIDEDNGIKIKPSLNVNFKKAGRPQDISFGEIFEASGNWTKITRAFEVHRDYEENEAQLSFMFGGMLQSIDLGGVEFVRYPSQAEMPEIPITKATYPGREANAQWREDALQRIEEIRKGNIEIQIVDVRGQPIQDVSLNVEMKQHEFIFGTAMREHWISLMEGKDADLVRDLAPKLFNTVVLSRRLKWPFWPDKDFVPEKNTTHLTEEPISANAYVDQAFEIYDEPMAQKDVIEAMKWIKNNGMHLRGHAILWPSWEHTVAGLKDFEDNPDTLQQIIHDWIVHIATTTAPWVDEWDMINEPFVHNDLLKILGEDIISEWFKIAHEVIPDKPLIINDFGILAQRGLKTDHQDYFYNLCKRLKELDTPISGIGFQSHMGTNITPPERIIEVLDRFSDLDLPVTITEFDLNRPDLELQHDYQRDFLIAIFSHPSVRGFMMWGFWAPIAWYPDSAFYGPDWSLRPQGKAYIDLVFNKWWSNLSGKTNHEGIFEGHGFYGDYGITAEKNGHKIFMDYSFSRDSESLKIIMP
jgi:hypothetical protein